MNLAPSSWSNRQTTLYLLSWVTRWPERSEHEFIGNVESDNMEPHTAIGNVHDNTLARQRAVADWFLATR